MLLSTYLTRKTPPRLGSDEMFFFNRFQRFRRNSGFALFQALLEADKKVSFKIIKSIKDLF